MWLFQPSRAPPLPFPHVLGRGSRCGSAAALDKKTGEGGGGSGGGEEGSEPAKRATTGREGRRNEEDLVDEKHTLRSLCLRASLLSSLAEPHAARPLPLRAHSHTQSRLRTLEPCHRLTLSLRAPLSGEPLALAQPVCCPAAGVRSATGTHL